MRFTARGVRWKIGSRSNDPSLPIQTLGLILKLSKESYFFSAPLVLALGSFLPLGRERMQALILGQADDVVDSHSLPPAEHLPQTKAAVGAHRNFDFGPTLVQPLNQQRQNRPRMFGRIDVALAQVTDQQLVATKDVQR